MDKRHSVYAISYKERIQAITAVRALFAEVYEMLLKANHKIELRAFDPEISDCPQFARIDDVACVYAINFSVVRETYDFSYVINVTFEPSWNFKKVNGFKKLNAVTRKPSTCADMSPASICKFVLRCIHEMRIRESVISEKEIKSTNERLRQAENSKHATSLKESCNIDKGRVTVFACHDVPKFSKNEVWVQFRGSPEDARRVLKFIEQEFPSQTITSQE